MKTINLLVAFIFALLLTACAGGPEIQQEVVTNTRTKVIYIPDTLLSDCQVSPPPNQTKYVAAADKERTEMLVTYSQDLLKDMAKCNNNIGKIRKLQKDQQAIYDKTMEKH
jgi:hypothetical protein